MNESPIAFPNEEVGADQATAAIPEVFSWIYCCCIPCCCLATLPGTGLYFLIAFNAIGGAIFAAVAASMGE